MAENAKTSGTGEGFRVGSVSGRSQFELSNGRWMKRDTSTGRFMKSADAKFKGVAREKDGRKHRD
jgi:hypothetical protein